MSPQRTAFYQQERRRRRKKRKKKKVKMLMIGSGLKGAQRAIRWDNDGVQERYEISLPQTRSGLKLDLSFKKAALK